MMAIHQAYHGHHFMMYVSQIIMPHTLNLYSAVCQLYLSKTGRKKYKNYVLPIHRIICQDLFTCI